MNIKKSTYQLITVTMLAAVFSGCATILNEETQSVNIASSNGKQFEGTIDGQPFEGPGIVKLKRAKADKIIVVTTPGCVKQTSVNKKVDGKFFVNILSGGAFGSTTDYVSEKMWAYDDNITISCGS